MILDGLLLFSSAQSDITAANTYASTNVVDLVNARDLGVGDPSMKVMVEVITAMTGGTAVQFAIQGSTDNTTYTTYASSAVIADASLTAGSIHFPIKLPRRTVAALPRYLRMAYVSTGTHTGGTVTSALVLDDDANYAYPAGLTVSN